MSSCLIPENVVRKLDSLGRITLPKGLRDRMNLIENAELEIFTARIDGRNCVCLSAPQTEEDEIAAAIEFLNKYGYVVEEGKA